MNQRHLVFDLDGTISDPALGITRSMNYALAAFGCDPVSEDSVLKRVGQARGDGDAVEWTRRFEDEMADVLGQLLVLAKLSGADLDAAVDRKWLRWHPSRMSREAYHSMPPNDSGVSE